MFRKMRRFQQELSAAETREIFEKESCGVLACAGDDGYPYAVPLSYVYADGHIYFHCALEGHKLDAMRRCEKVSFCVVGQDQVIAQELTTYFRSAIAFGRARIVEDPQERREKLTVLGLKYGPELHDYIREHIDKDGPRAALIDIEIEHMTGKEARELMRQRSKS